MPKLRNQVSAAALTPNATSVAASQTIAGGSTAVINGTNIGAVVLPGSGNITVPGPNGPILVPGNGHPVNGVGAIFPTPVQIAIASAGNDSGITFKVTGLDIGGNLISEVIAGGSTATVTTKNIFSQVFSVTPSGATAAAITVGNGATVLSPWLILGSQRNHYQYNLRAWFPTGSGTYDLQATSDPNVMLNTGGQADDIITLLAAQAVATTTLEQAPFTAVRLSVAAGSVILRALESRTA